MGRRKEPRTLEELLAEKEYTEKKKTQAENRIKILNQKYKKEERAARTHRLCDEAGDAENLVPELKCMTKQEQRRFFEIAFDCPEAKDFIEKWKEEHETDETEPDMAENY